MRQAGQMREQATVSRDHLSVMKAARSEARKQTTRRFHVVRR
ncbi:hypothetical protein I551_8537 [Mycobacterium ulcerans str. Harvey]|uniref:Uncharacterized protein n=1 Tax=Mycobacterium ulcerans str. Harvey TaxID=1299332 RepID=A0ABN0RAG6_MYCUL|nr:hypothetical protein I551_8537 [Mycobacterium ulcerans str. Harvey]